jgi:P-type Ca2+ transporter type 2C
MTLPDAPHTQTKQELYDLLQSSSSGLEASEASRRMSIYGPNTLKEEKRSVWVMFLEQFKSPIVIVLIIAAALSLGVGKYTDAIFILAILIINSLLGFFQEYKAETSILALKQLTKTHVRILRGGVESFLSSDEIVPGDIVLLGEGDLISADIRLLEAYDLQVDESTLTGESIPTLKNPFETFPVDAPPYERANMLFSGTYVVKGTAKGLVTATAAHTYLASIAKSVEEKSPDSPLTRSLGIFSKRLVIVLIGILILVGIIGILYGKNMEEMASILLAELVSAVPEGLPIVITLILALGAYRLSRHKVLVRHLPSVESLGSASVIATDKTGTITQGFLSVAQIETSDIDTLKRCAALCNDATRQHGDPVDVALAQWMGDDFDVINKENERIFYHPFDSKRRFMATINEDTEKNETLYIKGAYESLSQMAINTPQELQRLAAIHDEMASRGLRLLAFGVSHTQWKDPSDWRIKIIALVGFADGVKEGVQTAVEQAHNAGIKVMMITGDNLQTAQAIATNVGIYDTKKNVILSGVEIEKMSDEQLNDRLQGCTVVARALPEHKYRIVKLLQKKGEIVAVTGDGVNDVPALKAADLGIAMGNGSEAAKATAKMIITDNNLGIIVDAIRQGRIITANLRKVIFYLLATCFDEILLISGAIIIGLPLPIYATQILWVNIVTDGVTDKTFPMCREEGNVMQNAPKRLEKQFFDRWQIARIAWVAVVNASVALLFFIYLLHHGYHYDQAVTVSFCIIVISQWINGILAQKEHEPFLYNLKKSIIINPTIWIGVGIGVILQSSALYLFPSWLHVVPPNSTILAYIGGASAMVFVLIESYKWLEWSLRKRFKR